MEIKPKKVKNEGVPVQTSHQQRQKQKGQFGRTGNINNNNNNCNNSNEFVELIVNDINILHGLWLHFPFIYKIGETSSSGGNNGPILLQQVCKERGWKEFSHVPIDSHGHPLQEWNLHWFNGKSTSNLKNIYNWQISNHSNCYSNGGAGGGSGGGCNNNNYSFTMKNGCSRYLKRLQNTFGSIFDFSPLTFNLPSDYSKLCSEHSRRRKMYLNKLFSWEFEISLLQQQQQQQTTGSNNSEEPPIELIRPIWICKPIGKSRGRGIIIFDSPEKLNYIKHCVVQEYISRPYLIGGYKWDLRLYVVVVSKDPFVVYMYNEGLVRFSTSTFNLNQLSNVYSHLTNTSVNRESPEYLQVKNEVGKGCKWPLSKLRSYWKSHHIQDWYLWQRVFKIILLTVVSDTNNVYKGESVGAHFDLLGFDIIIDQELNPYLLEVNINPALSLDCEIDEIVKKSMLHDLFDLLGLPDSNHFQNQFTTPAYLNNSNDEVVEEGLCTTCRNSQSFKDNNNNNNNFNDDSEICHTLTLTATSERSSSSMDLDNNNNEHSQNPYSTQSSKISLKSPRNKNNFRVTYVNGAKNAYNEIIKLACKSNHKSRSISTIINNNNISSTSTSSTINEDNNNSSNSLELEEYDSLSIVEQHLSQPYHTSHYYRENPYFQSIGCPGQMQIHPPLHVKIPIKKRPCKVRHPPNYLDRWRTGLTYKIRDWTKSSCSTLICSSNNIGVPPQACPEQVGGWIRVYPFDHTTYSLSCKGKHFDMRTFIQHVQTYMKLARDISLNKITTPRNEGNNDLYFNNNFVTNQRKSNDYKYDKLLVKLMQLNTKVWHPPESSSSASTNVIL